MDDVLDSIANDYNHSWCGEMCWKASQLRKFLSGLSPTERHIAFGELCHIELRRDWTWWLKWVRSNHEATDVEQVLLGLEGRAHSRQLIQLAAEFQINLKGREDSIRFEEYSTRMEIGDAPIPHVEDAHLMLSLPPSKKYFSARRLPASERTTFPLFGKTIFGRQRKNGEAKGAMVYREEASRFVFTDSLDNRFSREQFYVRIINQEFAVVCNLSHNNPLDAGPKMLLAPNSSRLVKFPFQINLLEFEMNFFSF